MLWLCLQAVVDRTGLESASRGGTTAVSQHLLAQQSGKEGGVWHCATVMLQLQDELAVLRQGRLAGVRRLQLLGAASAGCGTSGCCSPAVGSVCSVAMPVLSHVSPSLVGPHLQPHRLTLCGTGLASAGCEVLCRMDGRYLPVEQHLLPDGTVQVGLGASGVSCQITSVLLHIPCASPLRQELCRGVQKQQPCSESPVSTDQHHSLCCQSHGSSGGQHRSC